jgi:hypothetical protein
MDTVGVEFDVIYVAICMTVWVGWAEAGNLLKLGGSDYHATGTLEETELGSITIPTGVMLQFLTTALPIWLSALRVIIEDFAENNRTVHSDRVSEPWKGDIIIRKSDREVSLILSPLLTEDEKSLVQREAMRLGLSCTLVSEEGCECIAVNKRV